MRHAARIQQNLLIFFCLIATACGGNMRQKTLRATFVGVNTARDGFLTWDKQEQDHIVQRAASVEEGTAQLTAHTQRIQPVVEGFTIVYEALALAAIEPSDKNLNAALAQAKELYDLINVTATEMPPADPQPK